MELEAGRVIAERYRLERKLAAGGMGEVWVATHLKLGAPIALKFMVETAAGVARARFEREAKAAARLASPHVVRVFDYGFDGDAPFIAMDLYEGEPLEAKLAREGALPLPVCSALLAQIARGLSVAHAAGIVHRDVKPANLFLAKSGGATVLKILDFGIAKESRHSLVDEKTKSGVMLGSPHHMSPEQARGGDVDARSDLWSVAVVLFRMLTGERPFAGVNVGDVIAKICSDALPRPCAVNAALPPAVDAFFQRAFARNPAARFGSALELSRAFDQAVGLPEAIPLEELAAVAASAPGAAANTLAREEATQDVPAPAAVTVRDAATLGAPAPAPARDGPTLDLAVSGAARGAVERTLPLPAVAAASDAPASRTELGLAAPVPGDPPRGRARSVAFAAVVALGVSGGWLAFTSLGAPGPARAPKAEAAAQGAAASGARSETAAPSGDEAPLATSAPSASGAAPLSGPSAPSSTSTSTSAPTSAVAGVTDSGAPASGVPRPTAPAKPRPKPGATSSGNPFF